MLRQLRLYNKTASEIKMGKISDNILLPSTSARKWPATGEMAWGAVGPPPAALGSDKTTLLEAPPDTAAGQAGACATIGASIVLNGEGEIKIRKEVK